MKRIVRLLVSLTLMAPATVLAQQHLEVPRADGAKTPLLVFDAQHAHGCPPLVLLSHGAGGSEEHGLRYLAEALSRDGWRAIAIGHRESGLEPLKDDMRAAGVKQGLRDLVGDAAAYRARFLDIDAALAWSQAQCHAPFRVLAGHSMGAITVMLEAGAHNKLGLEHAGGFDAYVALSPEGPGIVFPENAWASIRAPMLLITGTRDAGLDGDYTWRARAFDGLGPGCRWLAIIDGATHMNLGGMEARSGATKKAATLVVSYLDGVREKRCPKLVAETGVTLRSK
jgi:predicted dienelactone hydrolase